MTQLITLQALLNLPSITDCQMKLVCKSSVLLSAMMISLEHFYYFRTWSLWPKFRFQRQGVRQESLKKWFSSSLFSKVEYFLEVRKVLLCGRANWRSRYAARGCRNSDGNALQCNCKPQLGSKTITGIFPVLLIGGPWTSLVCFCRCLSVYFIPICQFVQRWEVSLVITWTWRIKATATLGKS